jgi:hypothetical protein
MVMGTLRFAHPTFDVFYGVLSPYGEYSVTPFRRRRMGKATRPHQSRVVTLWGVFGNAVSQP